MASLPKTQKAAVKTGTGEGSTAVVQEVPVPVPGEGQILVALNWTGICATDKSFIFDEWATLGPQAVMQESAKGIAGHEGAGVVAAVHPSAENLWKIGERVGVKWIASVCGTCEFCTNGRDEVHCRKQTNSGLNVPGTFQQYVVTDARYATRLPEGVSDEEAGPIMCGGLTAYVACKRANCRTGQWIVLVGAGGGLGHLGIQYAKAMGLRIIAVDAGDEKGELCTKLGAEKYIDFTKVTNLIEEIMSITTYGAHAVIVFSGSAAAYQTAVMLLRPSGTLVAVGLPPEPTAVAGGHPAIIAMRQINVVGSVVGTRKEVEEALDLTARGLVKPQLTKGKLADLDSLVRRMRDGKLPGRAVVQVSE